MAYRVQGKSFLITWSQVTHNWAQSNDDIFESLHQVLCPLHHQGKPSPTRGVICLENHQDGGDHVHAYVEFENKVDFQLRVQWDYAGRRPNVKSKRTKPERFSAYDYCLKDGTFFHFGDWIPFNEERSSSQEKTDRREHIILADEAQKATNFSAFLQTCLEASIPFGYCSAAWGAAKTPELTIPDDELERSVGGTISSDQLNFMVFDQQTTRALVIIGPTGCGKTVWARRNAPGPSLFIRHIDDLKQFRVGFHRSIVFDDMNFAGDEVTGKGAWPRTSQIHLVDFHCGASIHTRYTAAYVPAGVHKIFTGNSYMFTRDPAIDRRILCIDLF